MDCLKEIVLITGGAGFLGQHIVRELQMRRSHRLAEIRILDLKKYHRYLDHDEPVPVVSIIGDVTQPERIRRAFYEVDCVIHCAAYVSYEYPPNLDKLHEVNVKGTESVIRLCREFDVPRLVFTSTAEVCFVPYMGRACLTVIVNQTEKKALPPADRDKFVIPGYASSKHSAERAVLAANGTTTRNGSQLKTVALRPPLTYGEQDPTFVTSILSVSQKFGGRIPKIAGAGGKQQVVYAGNVAWAHICAMEALSKDHDEISGLPAFITDDTPVEDATRFCERITRDCNNNNNNASCKPFKWYVPMLLSFLIAMIVQTFSSITSTRLPVSPCGLVSYLSSFILFSRLRAAIHMDYTPAYDEEVSIAKSSQFYIGYYSKLNIRKQTYVAEE